MALIALVLGGIYCGIFTPTEAGAVGTIGALILVFLKCKGSMSELQYALRETGLMTAGFFLLLIGAQMFSRMLAVSGIVGKLASAVVALPAPPLLIISIMLVALMIMGAFLDCISIMIIVLPIILPAVKALGFDTVWFGIVSVVAIETGLVTPPFGMVPFTIKASIGDLASLEDIFIGAFPFFLMMILVIVLLVLFPVLSTWLPSTM
jgi:tripartite ATP-independent transporter DctM subunit